MADTAYDQAAAWLADQLHDVLCGGSNPQPGDQTGRLVHACHHGDARDILAADGCDVREETWSQYVIDPATGEETGPHRMRQLVIALPSTRDEEAQHG